MQDESDNENDDDVVDLLDYSGYSVGMVAEFKQDVCLFPQQGRIMSIFSLGDVVHFSIHLLVRPWEGKPKDFTSKDSKIFEYWETQEEVDILFTQLQCIVPSCEMSAKRVSIADVIEEGGFTREECKTGCLWISKFFDGISSTFPIVNGLFALRWHHFDYDAESVRKEDFGNAIWFIVKEVVFNPFVSKSTLSGNFVLGGDDTGRKRPRRNPMEVQKNVDLWEFMLLHKELAQRPFADLERELQQHPLVRVFLDNRRQQGYDVDSLKDVSLLSIDKMIHPDITLPFIFTKIVELKAYLHLSEAEELISDEETESESEDTVTQETEATVVKELSDVVKHLSITQQRRAYACEIWYILETWKKEVDELLLSLDRRGASYVTDFHDNESDGSESPKRASKKRKAGAALVEGGHEDLSDEDSDDESNSLDDFIVEADGDEPVDENGDIEEDDDDDEQMEVGNAPTIDLISDESMSPKVLLENENTGVSAIITDNETTNIALLNSIQSDNNVTSNTEDNDPDENAESGDEKSIHSDDDTSSEDDDDSQSDNLSTKTPPDYEGETDSEDELITFN